MQTAALINDLVNNKKEEKEYSVPTILINSITLKSLSIVKLLNTGQRLCMFFSI